MALDLSRDRPASGNWGRAAVTGVVLYVAIDVALVFLRPRFSVLHDAESDYGSRGPYAWLMDLNFVLRGLLSLAAVRALWPAARGKRRLRAGLGALAVWAVASGLLALFPDDPVGTPTHGTGRVHLALAAVAFVGVAVGARLVTRALGRVPGWRPVVPPLAILSWGAVVPLLLLGHSHLRPHSLGGLYEKVFLAMQLLWFAVVGAWVALGDRRRSRATAPEPAGEARLLHGLEPGPLLSTVRRGRTAQRTPRRSPAPDRDEDDERLRQDGRRAGPDPPNLVRLRRTKFAGFAPTRGTEFQVWGYGTSP